MSTDDLANESDELEAILDRIKEVTGVSTDAGLHRELETSSSAIPTWRKRGTVPYATFVAFARKQGLSLDWLLDGRGPRYPIEWGAFHEVEDGRYKIREQPPTFEGRLAKLGEASDRIMRIAKQHGLDIDPGQDARVLEFVYRHQLDDEGVYQLLRMLDMSPQKRGEQ